MTSLISLDRDAGEPLYRQLRLALQQAITAGRLEPGAPLPASRALADELGLSRNTVQAAYDELIAEGFAFPRARSGLYVSAHGDNRLDAAAEPGATPSRLRSPGFWETRLQPRADAQLPEIDKRDDWYRYQYPFIVGQFDPTCFPTLAWSRAMRSVLHHPHLHHSLRDAITSDDPLLVRMLCHHVLPARGIEARPEQVLITMGSQQALQLVSGALLGPGSVAAVEEPGYPDALHIFTRAGAELRRIPVDAEGLIVPTDLTGTTLVYVTPSHHFPTNVTMSATRRRALLDRVRQSGSIVIEDDYDSEMRYEGSPTLALKALDGTGHVVYSGTFSKFLAPGLRLGYLVADEELIEYLRRDRRYSIRHPPGQLQRALALLIQSGQYQRTIRQHRKTLATRWQTMRRAIRRHFPPSRLEPPPGGVSIWYQGPPTLNCVDIRERALVRSVVIERGDIFFARPELARHHLRLGFGSIPTSSIEPGIRVLAEVISQQLTGQ